MVASQPIPSYRAATKTFKLIAQHPQNFIVSSPQKFIRAFNCKTHCLSIHCHGTSLAPTTANDVCGVFLDVGMEENLTHKVSLNENGSRWSDVDMRNVEAAQRKMIEGLPPKMSGRSKALMRHIICMAEEDDPYALIVKWVKTMKPKRVDWLAILKQMNAYNHPLFFKISEIALGEEAFEANVRDYTKLIDAYAREDCLEDAEKILGIMEDRGFMCDAITFTVLIRMYGKASKLDQARHMFEKMKIFGLQLDHQAYGAMIMAYVREGMPEAGESLIREMEAKDIHTGTEVYKALLKSFARQGNAAGAQRIFNSMQFVGISPNLNSCTVLVEAYAHAGDPEQARIVFENMRKAGLQPGDRCTSIMVFAYEKKNLLGKALTMLLDLEKDGVKPGAETSSLLIDWLGKLGFVEEAEQFFLEISEMGEVPLKVLVSLCGMYARAGLCEKAINILDTMQHNCLALDVCEFERLFHGLLAGGLIDQAKKMHEKMQIQGLSPSESIPLALISYS